MQKYRFLSNFLPKSNEKKLVILTGARQTGKTTLAKFKYTNLRYINLDAPENRTVLREIISSSWGNDIGNSIIDEAQKEPSIFEKIKYSYDEKQISFTLLLGSSQILLLKKIRESLAGRVSIYELWPLLASEISRDISEKSVPPPLFDKLFSNDSLDKIFKEVPSILLVNEDQLLKRAENYLLQWGGMPALLNIPPDERWKWLKDYEYTYLERDLSDLARLNDLEPFRKFQKLSALRSAGILNSSEIARDAGISVDTVRRYFEYLKISYQVIFLQPYYRNITSSVIKSPKLYWVDIGLLRQLTGYKGECTGQIFETMVVDELIKWMRTAQKTGELYFYRTRSGFEVDILLQTEHGLIGMEIKSREKFVSSDIGPLKEIANKLKNDWKGGLLIYRGNEIKKIGEPNIWAVPFRRLFC